MDFSGILVDFSGLECLLYRRGEARRRRRRGDGGSPRRLAAAAPRRPRAAVINDAFPRPHANCQLFIVNRVFECLIHELLAI